jgi:hypothetical protein
MVRPAFGFVKLRYRRVHKKVHRLSVTRALGNRFLARDGLLRVPGT